jgi:hypothetical protein
LVVTVTEVDPPAAPREAEDEDREMVGVVGTVPCVTVMVFDLEPLVTVTVAVR